MSWGNLTYAICEHQSHRWPCASAEIDYRLLVRCLINNIIPILSKSNISRLVCHCNWAGRCESYLVANPEGFLNRWLINSAGNWCSSLSVDVDAAISCLTDISLTYVWRQMTSNWRKNTRLWKNRMKVVFPFVRRHFLARSVLRQFLSGMQYLEISWYLIYHM